MHLVSLSGDGGHGRVLMDLQLLLIEVTSLRVTTEQPKLWEGGQV